MIIGIVRAAHIRMFREMPPKSRFIASVYGLDFELDVVKDNLHRKSIVV